MQSKLSMLGIFQHTCLAGPAILAHLVAKVAAPASDPSLRKLPRSIQFQGLKISISVSRSLQNKHEQRHARAVDTSGKQTTKKQKRQANKQQAKQKQQHTPAQVPFSGPAASEADVGLPRAMPDEEPLLEALSAC